MRFRPIAAVAVAAAAAVALPAHAAAPVLDGKAHKVLSFKDAITAAQDNDKDIASLAASDRTACAEPRCSKFSFRYKPAKGVRKGPFSARIAWSYPFEDYDIYVVQDNAGDVGHCGASAGTSETVVVAKPVPGHVYTVVVDHYRAVPDTVNVTVAFPTKQKIATTAPSVVETNPVLGLPVNCGLS
jgi:hypothetical protein